MTRILITTSMPIVRWYQHTCWRQLIRADEWYPHHLRPQDLLTDEVVVVDYGRYVLDVSGVPESTYYHYDQWAYTRMLKVAGGIKGRYEYFYATY